MAADRIRLRGGDLHRRSGPGRGAGARARKGADAGHRGREHPHRRRARGIRARFRLPDVPGQRTVRGAVSAGYVDRAAADLSASGADRAGIGRGCGGAWRDGQGQRPGPVRAQRLCAGPVDQGDRALAGMGPDQPHQADRVRREEPDPHRQGQARRGALQRGREPAAHLQRGQGAGEPGRGRARLCLSAHREPRGRARSARVHRGDLREGRCGGDQWRDHVARHDPDQAERTGRPARHRPSGFRREPLRRHEIARHL